MVSLYDLSMYVCICLCICLCMISDIFMIYDFCAVLFEIQHLQYVVGLGFTIKEYIVFFFLLEGFKLHLF